MGGGGGVEKGGGVEGGERGEGGEGEEDRVGYYGSFFGNG